MKLSYKDKVKCLFYAKIISNTYRGDFMRKDILDVIRANCMKSIKPNFASLVRQYNCDPRTVKISFPEGKAASKRKAKLTTASLNLISKSLKIR